MKNKMNTCPSFHYTPREICEEIFKDIDFKETDITLEPCKGRDGETTMYGLIPGNKDWCEIEYGRDFFTYEFSNKFDKIITNPPYRGNEPEGIRKNIGWDFIRRCFELIKDDGEVWLLLNHKMFNSLTPKRLNDIQPFNIHFMRILNIKLWYGRYYWVCFKKGEGCVKYTYK